MNVHDTSPEDGLPTEQLSAEAGLILKFK